MSCDFKTMIKLAIGLGLGLVAAYFALPEFRTFIVAAAPVLLALICPLAMVIMMFAMKDKSGAGHASTKSGEDAARTEVRDAAPGKP